MPVVKIFILCRKNEPFLKGDVKTLRYLCSHSQIHSFLDILQDSNPTQDSKGDQLALIVSTDTAGQWQHSHVEDSSLPVELELQNITGNDQDTIFGDHGGFGIRGLQIEANALFNPEWSLGLGDSAVIPNPAENVATGYFDAPTPDLMPYSQHHGWDRQSGAQNQAGCAYLQATDPACSNLCISGCMLTSLQDITAPAHAQPDTIQQLDITHSHAFSNLIKPLGSLPIASPEECPKSKSKRKRFKTALSRKKPCLIPSYNTHDKDSTASKIGSPSRYDLDTQANITFTNDDKILTGPRDNDSQWRPQAGCPQAWEQERNGRKIFENMGINVSASERRPMSWPYRNPWRRSLDISVAVLTKGFEKLVTESSPTAV